MKRMKALVLIGVISPLMAGCPAAVCQHLETRCANDVSQVCDSRGQWQDVMDCGEAACQVDDEGDPVCQEVTP